jgi:hypothetical protein
MQPGLKRKVVFNFPCTTVSYHQRPADLRPLLCKIVAAARIPLAALRVSYCNFLIRHGALCRFLEYPENLKSISAHRNPDPHST